MQTPEARIDFRDPRQTVNDITRWSVKRNITTTLPEQVRLGTGTAKGDARWRMPVKLQGSQPWRVGGVFITRSARVSARLSPDDVWLPLFSGVVEQAAGEATDSTLEVRAADDAQRLQSQVSIPATPARAPRRVRVTNDNGDPQLYTIVSIDRLPGLNSVWPINYVARTQGYYSTFPPPSTGTVQVAASLMGSALPETGYLFRAEGVPEQETEIQFQAAPWGRAMSRGRIDLTEFPDQPWTGSGSLADGGKWRVTAMTDFSQPGYSDITFDCGNYSTFIKYVYPEGGVPYVGVHYNEKSTGQVAITDPRDQLVSTDTTRVVVDLEVLPSNNWLKVTFTTANGSYTETIGSTVGEDSSIVSDIWGYRATVGRFFSDPGPGIPLGGVQVVSGVTTPPDVSWEQNAILDNGLTDLDAIPLLDSRPAWELLQEIIESEFGGLWIDEHGRLVFRNRENLAQGALRNGAVPALTADNSLLNLGWQESGAQVASSVSAQIEALNIDYAQPTTGDANAYNAETFWRLDSVEEVKPGTAFEQTIQLDAVPFEIRPVFYGTNVDDFRVSRFYLSDSQDEYNPPSTNPMNDLELTVIDQRTVHVRVFNPTQQSWFIRGGNGFDGEATPGIVLRANAVIRESGDKPIVSSGDRDYGSPVVLEDSPWRQRESITRLQTAWLLGELGTSSPAVKSVSVHPDIRLKLGDRVSLIDPYVTGVSVDAVVLGVELDGSPGQLEQKLTVRLRPVLWGDYDRELSWADINSLGWAGWNAWSPGDVGSVA